MKSFVKRRALFKKSFSKILDNNLKFCHGFSSKLAF